MATRSLSLSLFPSFPCVSINLSTYIYIYIYNYLSFYTSPLSPISVSIYLPLYLHDSLSFFYSPLFLWLSLSLPPSVYLSFYQYICITLYLFTHFLSRSLSVYHHFYPSIIYESLFLYINLSICLYIYTIVCLYTIPSPSIYLSIYSLTIYLSLFTHQFSLDIHDCSFICLPPCKFFGLYSMYWVGVPTRDSDIAANPAK